MSNLHNSPLGVRGLKKYKGVVVPTVTPLTSNYQLDEAAVEKMFQHFYASNVEPFILGTTGEAASIATNIKKQFVQKAAAIKKQGSLLYFGISSNCLEESIELSNHAAEVGADVVVATIPSYYALTELQTKTYFETLANKSLLPMIIYNIPATTHVSLPLEWLDMLSHHPNIVAAKDSERSDERLEQSVALWKDREDFSHF
nr:dihydrodipicolinate synthase family protein [Chitinophagaceae bacterium]